jgi:hypothetical protein
VPDEEVVAQEVPRGVVVDDEHLAVVRAPAAQLHQVPVPELGQVAELVLEP